MDQRWMENGLEEISIISWCACNLFVSMSGLKLNEKSSTEGLLRREKKFNSYGSIQPQLVNEGDSTTSSTKGVRRFSASSAALPDPTVQNEIDNDDAPVGRQKRSSTIDEFNVEGTLPADLKLANLAKALRTGRQRKKTAARTKGGEFQARRKKRRVYFCCISNDIDVEKLADEFQVAHFGMKGQMYDEVLHLYLASNEEAQQEAEMAAKIVEKLALNRQCSEESVDVTPSPYLPKVQSNSGLFGVREPLLMPRTHSSFEVSYKEDTLLNEADLIVEPDQTLGSGVVSSGHGNRVSRLNSYDDDGYFSSTNHNQYHDPDQLDLLDEDQSPRHATMRPLDGDLQEHDHEDHHAGGADTPPPHSASSPLGLLLAGNLPPDVDPRMLVASLPSHTEHSKEVFVFGFGAAVYWGLAKSEVQDLLQFIESFIVKEPLSKEEFEAGEDDMAFVTDYDQVDISIANDVITLPPLTTVKERLAVSFAIAQSAVLTIFEARVEKKTEEYKYIPEVLAQSGKVDLSPKQLGVMIGEVFVMQHDVNLHSEILDLPDYFWKEHAVEPLYRMTMDYMEMVPRISVLNKRLDLLRQLLRVLQQQHENAHSVKLEWIVIWLIVMSCVLEMWDIIKDVFGIELGHEV